jgi:hypothetical protein
VTAAIFGFVGVLVGGLVTWGIEVWRARHGEQDEARVAARLVADELDTIYLARLKVHSLEPQFPRQIELALAQDAWMNYRATLARELEDESWNKVGGAYDVLATEFDDLESTVYSPAEVDESYNAGLAALKPLMTSKRRYWWQRVFRR